MTGTAEAGRGEVFEIGQKVTRRDVKPIVSPNSDVDFVEGFRLDRIGELSTELLSGQLPPHEAKLRMDEIRHWAGEEILPHFPVELSQTG